MLIDLSAIAQTCSQDVHPTTMRAIMSVESAGNPFAIGVVGGKLVRQPANKAEAVATAKALEKAGYNFSVGTSQVNRYNLNRYGLDYDKAFDLCANVKAGSSILRECYERAARQFGAGQNALRASFSCYYSGNFSTGFKPDFAGQPSYVQKVVNHSAPVAASGAAYAVPAIDTTSAPAGVAPIPVVAVKTTKARTVRPKVVQAPDAAANTVTAAPSDSAMVF
ncbi:lytic transglycosylase domain-containing protein [Burkholderia ubonensis]|uniref:lytic transglycosylase domain-containing protein n=1 Tax=Burkholderia ubonensis TaxID=101571 RepID=UPI002AB29DFD|nr:lytic transglycosylase domain-containing protein [Burkholderia ubonensis]